MEYYRRSQYGYFIILPMLVVTVSFLTIGLYSNQAALTATGLGFLFLCALFYRLVVIVRGKEIVLIYGIGVIRKKILLERVVAVEPVRNLWWYGWGLRMYPGGWLYNIAGLDAVELQMSKRPNYRIGTADPIGLAGVVRARIGRD